MLTIYVPRAFGGTLIITLQAPLDPSQYLSAIWITRDGNALWVTRDGKMTWKARL